MTPTVTVCGLGPGGKDQLTRQTLQLLSETGPGNVFLRTDRHPTAEVATGAQSFDGLYETSSSFDQVYRQITDRLLSEANKQGHIVYAVPGSPLILERSVAFLRAQDDVEVEVLPAISFLDQVWASLGIDPVLDGVRLIDGLDFAAAAAGQKGPILVAHVHSQWVLSDIKLALDAGPEQRVIVLQGLGTDEERITEIGWPELDRAVTADHLTSIFLPTLAQPVGYELERSAQVMTRLRAECPWDAKQDHRSLRKYLIEEAYETLEALDAVIASAATKSQSQPEEPTSVAAEEASAYQDLEEELGDLWFQILFHSQLASERGQFTVADVARGMSDKMIRRHPHVFDHSVDAIDGSTGENWDLLKQQEKDRSSALDGIPAGLPALALAEKVLGRGAKRVTSPHLGQFGASIENTFGSALVSDAKLGELLLVLVEMARQQGVDAELALRGAVAKASDRFRSAERAGSTSDSWVLG